MVTRIKIRRDTLANWEAANPILEEGELAYITDTKELIIGIGDTFDKCPRLQLKINGG